VNDFNNRKGAQFKVELGKDGKLQVVKGSVAKDIGGAEAKLLGAVKDSENHATLNIVGNTRTPFFGVHTGEGLNTVDMGTRHSSMLRATRGASIPATFSLMRPWMLIIVYLWGHWTPISKPQNCSPVSNCQLNSQRI